MLSRSPVDQAPVEGVQRCDSLCPVSSPAGVRQREGLWITLHCRKKEGLFFEIPVCNAPQENPESPPNQSDIPADCSGFNCSATSVANLGIVSCLLWMIK